MATLTQTLGKEPTRGQIIAESVRLDFEFLSGWINDDWYYVGVVVTDITDDEDAKTDYSYALWGIESNCVYCIAEVAQDLIDQALAEYGKENRFSIAMNLGV